MPEYVEDSREQRGTLRLELVERLPAIAIEKIVKTIDDVYFAALWMDIAKHESPVSDSYSPTEDEQLTLSKAEIGTPNFIEFAGLAQYLANVAHMIPAVLQAAAAGVAVVGGYTSIKRDYAETKRAEMELEESETKTMIMRANFIRDGAQQLGSHKRISKAQLKHKLQMQTEAEEAIKTAFRDCVTKVKFTAEDGD